MSLPPPRSVAVRGVRFSLHRLDPPRRRRTPAVLLLHGVPGTAEDWAGVATGLAADRTVLVPDLVGCGASEARTPAGLPALAQQLIALVLHETAGAAVKGPMDVVGHSVGGGLAAAMAAERPDLVGRLALLAAPLPPWSWECCARLAAAGHGARPVLAYLRGLASHSGGWDTRTGPQRALVLWGSADRVLPLSTGEQTAAALTARLPVGAVLTTVLAGLGHRPHIEDPAAVAAVLGDFLRAR
ncbi:MAG: alpha/beta fold hydrolase [Mycobacteriales bacterium]